MTESRSETDALQKLINELSEFVDVFQSGLVLVSLSMGDIHRGLEFVKNVERKEDQSEK